MKVKTDLFAHVGVVKAQKIYGNVSHEMLYDFPSFSDASAEIFGISTDSFFSHKAWADALDLKHRLLADMHRTVCKSYGLYFDALNCAKRATVIVGKDGKVAYAKVQEIKTPRDDKEILDALKKIG